MQNKEIVTLAVLFSADNNFSNQHTTSLWKRVDSLFSLKKMIFKKRITSFAMLFLLCSCSHAQGIYNIVDFGAKADGKTVNTIAINRAIKACAQNGGGTVQIPAGTFISGTIIMLSNVELHLDMGAILKGSIDTSDYLLMPTTLFKEGYNRFGLIYAYNEENFAITGFGEIDGNGTYFMNGIDKPHISNDFDRKFIRQKENFMKPGSVFEDGPVSYSFRPGLLITILQCSNVHLRDVTLKDSPEWTIRFGNCDGVDVEGITIKNNPLIPNNDGIHCTTSRNITISNCKIFTGDDAIIVTGFGSDIKPGNTKSFGNTSSYAENVTVSNCILSSRSACIRVGYGENPIRNLVFNNLVMVTSNRGIGIFARNNSSIENVLFSNIIINTHIFSGHWWGKGEPVHISALRDSKNGTPGTIKNIHFYNLTVNSETGIVMQGSKDDPLENISFDGLYMQVSKSKYVNEYGGNFDLRPAYPKDSAIFTHDIPGLYAQYIKHLSINNMRLSWQKNLASFFTNGIFIDQYDDVQINNSSIIPAFKKLNAIELIHGKNTVISNTHTENGVQLRNTVKSE